MKMKIPEETARPSTYWHNRAEEQRVRSEAAHNPHCKATWIAMAEASDQLAEREKQLERSKKTIRRVNEILETNSWTVVRAVTRNPHLNVLSLDASKPEGSSGSRTRK